MRTKTIVMLSVIDKCVECPYSYCPQQLFGDDAKQEGFPLYCRCTKNLLDGQNARLVGAYTPQHPVEQIKVPEWCDASLDIDVLNKFAEPIDKIAIEMSESLLRRENELLEQAVARTKTSEKLYGFKCLICGKFEPEDGFDIFKHKDTCPIVAARALLKRRDSQQRIVDAFQMHIDLL
jgi:hypothetical protein